MKSMEINLESLTTELAVHMSGSVIDKVITTQCSANISVYLLNQKSSIKVVLDADEVEIYKQLATKIEDRVRQRIKKAALED